MTLDDCRNELHSIIRELRDIEWGIRHDFYGIGEQLCGNCVSKIANKYEYVLSLLMNVDYNNLAAWFIGDK